MNKNPIIYHNSDSLSQGKSMRYLANWDPHREYFNDNCIQDFVTCDGILWGCMENCKGHRPSEGCVYWSKAVVGPKGAKGKEIISIYEFDSTYDDDYSYSTIKVVYSDGTDDTLVLKNYRDKGEKGDKGDKGDPFVYSDFTEEQLKALTGPAGKDGKDGKDGIDGRDGINGKDGKDGLPGKDGINGKDGAPGKDGVDGKDGKDGKDGAPGRDGRDGLDGKSYIPSITTDGNLSFVPSDTPITSPILFDLDEYFVSHKELQTILDSFNLHWNIID